MEAEESESEVERPRPQRTQRRRKRAEKNTVLEHTDTSGPEDTSNLRRSRRTTAGKHSNPHHMPTSATLDTVLSQPLSTAQNASVAHLTEAISQLGSSLAQGLGHSLGQILQETWAKQEQSSKK